MKMNRQELYKWVQDTYGTQPDYTWNDWNAVLRHEDSWKWYALVLEVPVSKLGGSGECILDVLNVKCDPILVGSLRCRPGFYPAYHMNKETWISIALDGRVSDDEIKSLLAMSYELTGRNSRNNEG